MEEEGDKVLLTDEALLEFMLRRTHGDEMFGAPLLKLPSAHQSTYFVDFNAVERSIYEIVRDRFTKKINARSKNGELKKSYSNAMVYVLNFLHYSHNMWLKIGRAHV